MFLSSPLLLEAGVQHGFSTRRGGVSQPPWETLNLGLSVGDDPAAVEANILRLAQAAGFIRDRFRTALQVHGDRLLVFEDAAEYDPEVEADALLAAAPGLAVAVKTADCVPILLYHRGSGEAAAVHAGWRGTFAGIVQKAAEALARRAGDREPRWEGLLAAIGPSIGSCCYEVSPDLATRFRDRFGADHVRGDRLDLAAMNRQLLLGAGVPQAGIEVLPRCTSCEPGLFFSHRRDAGRTGRHLSFVVSGSGRPLS